MLLSCLASFKMFDILFKGSSMSSKTDLTLMGIKCMYEDEFALLHLRVANFLRFMPNA